MKDIHIYKEIYNDKLSGIRLVLILALPLLLVYNTVAGRRAATLLDVCVYEPFFSDSAFVGANYAWVVPISGGGLYMTRNGGKEWEHIPKEEFHGYRLISFVDIYTGWTIGEGNLWKTVDSGKNWKPVSGAESDIANLEMPRRLLFLNHKDGIILEAYRGVWITHDGGVKWEIIEDEEAELLQAYPIGTQSVLIETSDRSILNASIQKGRLAWKKSRAPRSLPIIDACFISSEYGWIVCENAIYKTENGGDLWLQQPPVSALKERGILQSIHFINNRLGWASATSSSFLKEHNVKRLIRNGYVFKTSDGGKTWQLLYEKLGQPFDKVYFGDSNNGWILADDKVLRSVDGGVTWFKTLDLKSPSKCT